MYTLLFALHIVLLLDNFGCSISSLPLCYVCTIVESQESPTCFGMDGRSFLLRMNWMTIVFEIESIRNKHNDNVMTIL